MQESMVNAVVSAAVSKLLPKRTPLEEACSQIIKEILSHKNFEALRRHLSESTYSDDEFWRDCGGVTGLLEQIQVSWHFLQLVQQFRAHHLYTKEHAREVWTMFFWQGAYGVIAIPEAFICHFIKNLHHICARESSRFFRVMTLQVYITCLDNAPKCVHELNELM